MTEEPKRAGAAPGTPRALRALGVLAALAALGLVATLVLPERLYPARTIALGPAVSLAPVGTAAAAATFARATLFRVPRSARVLESGQPLARVWCEPAALASGCWTGQGPSLAWTSTDGSSPVENGRRYELVLEPDTVLALLSLPGLALLGFAAVVLALAIRSGAISVTGPSPARTRAALGLAVVLAFGTGAAKSWDRIAVDVDSTGYLRHSPIRPCLYPAFLDVFDGGTGPRPELPATDDLHPEPGSRYAPVVHAQRVLTVIALAVLALALARTLNAWLVGALFFLGALLDTEWVGGSSSLAFHAGSLMSEGINGPLLFLFLAAVLEHLRRPGPARGALVAFLLALLLLNRPANVGLATALPFLWLVQARESGARRTARDAGLALLVLALPLVLACEANRERGGRFRLHAFMGPSLFGLALGTATEEDAAALEDPALRRFLETCVADPRRIRDRAHAPNGDDLNVNVYEIGYPAVEKTFASPGSQLFWVADDVFQATARHLLRRHPGQALAIVLEHVGRWLSPLVHGLDLAALALAAWLWRRQRVHQLLFAAALALLPFAYMLPICAFNFPSERYVSQIAFAQWLALPFVAVVALSRAAKAEGGAA